MKAIAVLVVMLVMCSPALCAAESEDGASLLNVGYRVVDIPLGAGSDETITVAIWYPTDAEASEHIYGGPVKGSVALDAAPLAEGGPWPLFVYSHGYGGGGIAAAFLTERLAANGWIVAAPDHHDADVGVRIRTGHQANIDRFGLLRSATEISVSAPETRDKFLYRLDELKAVIAGVTALDDFDGAVDTDTIALGGHSFGGFTVLGLAGAIAEYADPRVKAVVLFSSGAGAYLYTPEELARVKVPTVYFLGARERAQRRAEATMEELAVKMFSAFSPPKYLLEVRWANHFSFNERFVDDRFVGVLSGSKAHFDVIRRYTIAFLERYVKGDTAAGDILEKNDLMLTRIERDTGED
jgi:predicted dienelactone hydrolase